MAKTNIFRTADDSQTFAAGQTIFEQGQTGDLMYVVKTGEVELLVNGILVETLDAGDMFGEMALIEKEPRSATARAKTDCEVVPINEKRFSLLVPQTPYFALTVMKTMSERLRRMDTRVGLS